MSSVSLAQLGRPWCSVHPLSVEECAVLAVLFKDMVHQPGFEEAQEARLVGRIATQHSLLILDHLNNQLTVSLAMALGVRIIVERHQLFLGAEMVVRVIHQSIES